LSSYYPKQEKGKIFSSFNFNQTNQLNTTINHKKNHFSIDMSLDLNSFKLENKRKENNITIKNLGTSNAFNSKYCITSINSNISKYDKKPSFIKKESEIKLMLRAQQNETLQSKSSSFNFDTLPVNGISSGSNRKINLMIKNFKDETADSSIKKSSSIMNKLDFQPLKENKHTLQALEEDTKMRKSGMKVSANNLFEKYNSRDAIHNFQNQFKKEVTGSLLHINLTK